MTESFEKKSSLRPLLNCVNASKVVPQDRNPTLKVFKHFSCWGSKKAKDHAQVPKLLSENPI